MTKIEWVKNKDGSQGKTWNPITGCSKISPGCQNCYAERMAKRLAGRFGYPKDEPFGVTQHTNRLYEPTNWKKPSTVFTCSMGDLFHEDVSYAYIDMVFIVMSICPQHRFMVLTKRPERMLAYAKSVMSRDIDIQWPLPNVWLGVTAENQEMADKRIPTLLQIPAAVRFVSVEPMLGPVDLSSIPGFHYPGCTTHDALNGRLIHHDDDYKWTVDEKLDWVICGGESAPKARPMHPDWVRSLRDQCQEADVPFFFKQWGEWGKAEIDAKVIGGAKGQINLEPQDIVGIWMFKVGKKAAGRLLDGRTWDEIPEVHTNE